MKWNGFFSNQISTEIGVQLICHLKDISYVNSVPLITSSDNKLIQEKYYLLYKKSSVY